MVFTKEAAKAILEKDESIKVEVWDVDHPESVWLDYQGKAKGFETWTLEHTQSGQVLGEYEASDAALDALFDWIGDRIITHYL